MPRGKLGVGGTSTPKFQFSMYAILHTDGTESDLYPFRAFLDSDVELVGPP